MARGGQRDGAGRKQGIPNRLARENVDRAEKTGVMPLQYMLEIMRNSKAGNERRDAMARGLSGILCVRPVSLLTLEPFAKDDGELGPCLEPFSRRPFPVVGCVVENQI